MNDQCSFVKRALVMSFLLQEGCKGKCCRISRGELKEKIQVPLRVSFLRARLTSWWLLTREKGERGWSVIE